MPNLFFDRRRINRSRPDYTPPEPIRRANGQVFSALKPRGSAAFIAPPSRERRLDGRIDAQTDFAPLSQEVQPVPAPQPGPVQGETEVLALFDRAAKASAKNAGVSTHEQNDAIKLFDRLAEQAAEPSPDEGAAEPEQGGDEDAPPLELTADMQVIERPYVGVKAQDETQAHPAPQEILAKHPEERQDNKPQPAVTESLPRERTVTLSAARSTLQPTAQPLVRLAGVSGWPVHHSLSPNIHNYWLRQLGVRGGYTMFAVRPDEAIAAFKSLPQTSISGLNVTIPLKGKAYEAADTVTQEAQALGVCNCLYVKDQQLVGHNTDVEGFVAPLLAQTAPQYLLNVPITVVGAGGAARAVLGGLLTMGVPEIRLINRTNERTQRLVENINTPNLHYYDWDNMDRAIDGAGLLVNASAAGMMGKGTIPADLSLMAPGGVVYDLVYTPLVTDLLERAKIEGLMTIGGLDMLIAQARPSFKLFYGQAAPMDSAEVITAKTDLRSRLIMLLNQKARH